MEINYDFSKSAKDFLKDMEQRVIPYMYAFGRASRKVQEEHPHLRGKLWQKRKNKRGKVLKRDFNVEFDDSGNSGRKS
jgi:hypothetical protein